MNIIEFIQHPNLINDQTLSKPQEVILKSIYGLPLTPEELIIFKTITGLSSYPEGIEWQEITAILPRRSGKTNQITTNLAIYEACGRDHNISLGSIPTVMIVASEKRRQARIAFNYILRKLESSKVLSQMIRNITAEEIQLTNKVSIMVFPCDSARVRGHSLIMLVADEVAAWRSEGVNPDVDIIDSARPGLDFAYSKIIKISTPGGMFGEIYNDHQQFYGKENEDILVFGSGGHSTKYFNPSYSQAKLDRFKKRKPFVYQTEHLAEFRKTQGMFDPLIIDSLVNDNRPIEYSPLKDIQYYAFTDTAGGSGKSSYAICIGHIKNAKVIIDVVRSKNPPFDPETQTQEYSDLLHKYRITRVTGDSFSGDWCSRSYQKNNIFYEKSEKSKNEIYLECEGSFNCGNVELPPHDTLQRQLKLLIRSPRSGSRDRITTIGGQSEDEANVCCGTVWMINKENFEKPIPPSLGLLEDIRTPEEKSKEASISWLLDTPEDKKQKKKVLKPGEIDMQALELEQAQFEREAEAELRGKNSSKDVDISGGWDDD